MSTTDLKDALARELAAAGPRARALLDRAVADARSLGGDAARLAEEVAAVSARVLEEAARGEVDVDAAEEVADRLIDAMGEIAGGLAEGAARAAAVRARDAIGLAKDLAFALAKVGVAALAAGL